MCLLLCAILVHSTALNSSDNLPSYPPGNHHGSADVCRRGAVANTCIVIVRLRCKTVPLWCNSIVPHSANNVYTMPVDITLWGRLDTKAEVLRILRQHHYTVHEGLSQVPVHSRATSSNNNNSSANVSLSPPRRTFLNPTKVRSSRQ